MVDFPDYVEDESFKKKFKEWIEDHFTVTDILVEEEDIILNLEDYNLTLILTEDGISFREIGDDLEDTNTTEYKFINYTDIDEEIFYETLEECENIINEYGREKHNKCPICGETVSFFNSTEDTGEVVEYDGEFYHQECLEQQTELG